MTDPTDPQPQDPTTPPAAPTAPAAPVYPSPIDPAIIAITDGLARELDLLEQNCLNEFSEIGASAIATPAATILARLDALESAVKALGTRLTNGGH